jgi:hypothetical protein
MLHPCYLSDLLKTLLTSCICKSTFFCRNSNKIVVRFNLVANALLISFNGYICSVHLMTLRFSHWIFNTISYHQKAHLNRVKYKKHLRRTPSVYIVNLQNVLLQMHDVSNVLRRSLNYSDYCFLFSVSHSVITKSKIHKKRYLNYIFCVRLCNNPFDEQQKSQLLVIISIFLWYKQRLLFYIDVQCSNVCFTRFLGWFFLTEQV